MHNDVCKTGRVWRFRCTGEQETKDSAVNFQTENGAEERSAHSIKNRRVSFKHIHGVLTWNLTAHFSKTERGMYEGNEHRIN